MDTLPTIRKISGKMKDEARRQVVSELCRFMENDRKNYRLWTKQLTERRERNKTKIRKQADETLWRIFHILLAGVCASMSSPLHHTPAYRVLPGPPMDAEV